MDLEVWCESRKWRARWGAAEFACAVGRSGVRPAAEKREGDGATPAGRWRMRRLLYRPDRMAPQRWRLPAAEVAEDDGWCDAPDDPAYNQPVKRPFAASHERLWRDDGLYDLVVVLDYNLSPARPGRGSAIFLHCAKPGYPATEGCVALARADLEKLLADAAPGDAVEVRLPPQA